MGGSPSTATTTTQNKQNTQSQGTTAQQYAGQTAQQTGGTTAGQTTQQQQVTLPDYLQSFVPAAAQSAQTS